MSYLKKDVNKNKIIKDILNKNNCEAIILYNPKNRLWYSELNTTEGYILITKNKSVLYVDSRYILAAKQNAKNIDQIIQFGDVFQLILDELKKDKIKSIAFESDFITYDYASLFKNIFKDFKLVPINTKEIRTVKNNDEIKLIHEACKITEKTFLDVIKNIKIGMTEKEVDILIYSNFMKFGADEFSFPSIVASGERGAMPHGRASIKKINNNELVTIDFGCYYKGYSSDVTRTIAIGDKINPKLLEIYEIVKEAQELGIRAIKPGIKTKEIDDICRNYITEKGYGKYFQHSTGHGLGVDVHEFPRVSPYCDVKLQPGMVITVEPGIYIENLGGVRIEDDILVTDNGYKVLSNLTDKKLITIK